MDTAKARELLADPNESEAFAQALYLAFGGFVEWEMLPTDSRSKVEYREKARDLLKFLEVHRKHHGKVIAPLEPTPEMLAAGYRAMLAAQANRSAKLDSALTPASGRPTEDNED